MVREIRLIQLLGLIPFTLVAVWVYFMLLGLLISGIDIGLLGLLALPEVALPLELALIAVLQVWYGYLVNPDWWRSLWRFARPLKIGAAAFPLGVLGAMTLPGFDLWPWPNLVGLIPVAALLGPLVIEIYFRGYWQTWLRGHLGPWWTIGLSALPWALMILYFTGPLFALVELALAGLCAYSFDRRRSLWVPVIIRSLFNMTILAVLVAMVLVRSS